MAERSGIETERGSRAGLAPLGYPPPRPDFARRLTEVRLGLSTLQLDALLVTNPANLRYLVAFAGSTGALYISAGSVVLIVDGRYLTSARLLATALVAGIDVRVEHADGSIEAAIARVATADRARSLGVEAAVMTIGRFDRLARALANADPAVDQQVRPQPTERVIERLRMVKDSGEVATLREAARRLSDVGQIAGAFVQMGRSERAVARDIEAALLDAGFERPAFETIVASGPNSALPHARAGLRLLQPSDGVVLDFGGVYDGYCVDLTRTVQLPPLTDGFRQLHRAVAAAHAAAIAAVRPGALASVVDAAAREVLAGYGLGEAFLHATGHGLGLEVHEAPRIGKRGASANDEVDEVIAAGMVFTIEPGAYVTELGGVRIEDDVLVVSDGCQVLTDVPIDLTAGAHSAPPAPAAPSVRGAKRPGV